jgi:cytochrome c oxidase assembly protein subunit 15
MSLANYRRITLVALVSLVFITVTGAAVRLTGSGLGCETWPSCTSDSFAPRSASDVHGMIEWANRLVTGIVMVFTSATVVGALLLRPRRPDLFRWSLGLPAWVLANAAIGAMVVLLELPPISVIAHFLVSLGAVWHAVVLHQRAGEERAAAEPRRVLATASVVRGCRWLVAAAGAVVVTGTIVTGTGPHAGDSQADRLDFSLPDVVRIHAVVVVLFLLLTLAVLWLVRRGNATPLVENRLHQLLVVSVAQAGIGYTQYFTGVPALIVGVHVFGAVLVWISVLRVQLSLSQPSSAPAPARVAARARGDVVPA